MLNSVYLTIANSRVIVVKKMAKKSVLQITIIELNDVVQSSFLLLFSYQSPVLAFCSSVLSGFNTLMTSLLK